MVDLDGLVIWSESVWMTGCLLAEFLRCQVIMVEAGVGRRGGECVDGDMHLLS